jgi:hypothetical protein
MAKLIALMVEHTVPLHVCVCVCASEILCMLVATPIANVNRTLCMIWYNEPTYSTLVLMQNNQQTILIEN